MTLTPAHKELIKLLAAVAVEEFVEEQSKLLKGKPMERIKGETRHEPISHN